MTHFTLFQKGSPFRHVVSSALIWLVMMLSVILGAGGAIAAFFGAAFLFNTSSALFMVAFCVGLQIESKYYITKVTIPPRITFTRFYGLSAYHY